MDRSIMATGGRGVDEIVRRFEEAWQVDGEAELGGYLPEVGHPSRRAALLKLTRVDMAHRQASGRPRRVEDYLRDFPELEDEDFSEPAPAPSRPRPHFGAEVMGRPSPGGRSRPVPPTSAPESVGATVSRARPDLSDVARLYLDFRLDRPEGRDGEIDSWAASTRSKGDDPTVDLFVDLHNSDPEGASRLARAVAQFPRPGTTFLGFRLLGELGRGAFGRVYLASQGDLADRPVALKVSAEKPTESQTLAQLQHTNIVPIFSAHRSDPLHAVCMPYFGSTTLKDIYEDLEDRPSMPTSGRGLLETLASHRGVGSSSHDSGKAGPSTAPAAGESPADDHKGPDAGPGPRLASDTLSMLGKLSYVEAVLWIGARLADGLSHAHGRGILHRDLKPANILLTDSGQPMILDFNLSEDTKKPVSFASFGGTLPYMAPEHLRAFRTNGEEGGEVDARSDLYALGTILYELLAGRHPFQVYPGCSPSILDRMIAERSGLPDCLRGRNPQVSPAVESIVRHCLEPDPARRYQSASDLLEDLERHMADLPLAHAPEPSTRERLGKWARRHPRLTSSTSVAILLGCAALGLFAGLFARARNLEKLEAVASLAQLREEASTARYLLNTRVFDRDRRAGAVALGSKALGRYGVPDDPAWQGRPSARSLDPDDRRLLREEVGALLLFLARAGQMDAEGLKPEDPARVPALEAATRLCDVAAGCFDGDRAPRALLERRASLAGLLGRPADAARLLDEAGRVPLRTALDHEVAASALTIEGQYRKALPLALEATRLDPRDFWAWFMLGVCRERLVEDQEAAACFGTCIALRPDSPFGWFNRGVVSTRRADYEQARRDLERAAGLDPNWADARSELAIAENLAGRPAEAVRDYTRAIELGATETRIYFLRAEAKAKLGDAEGARLDRQEGLRREPRDDLGWVVRGMSRAADDAPGALADLDRALAINPRSLDALQDKAYVLAERLGRIGEAEVVLDRAVSLYPDYVPSRSARGVLRAILGRREAAHGDARESIWRDTSPRILYQVAGIYAVTSKQVPEDRVEACRLLSTALRGGFGFEELADDRELDAIRDQPEFRKLLEAARALRDDAPQAGPRP